MSNAPVANAGTAQPPVERRSDYAATAAYYVTRTTQPAAAGEQATPTTRTVTAEVSRSSVGNVTYPTDHELASKGALASLRHPPPSQYKDTAVERYISPQEVALSRAGSKAALRSVRDRAETLESRETATEQLLGDERRARMAATGAMATTHRKVESTTIREGRPDLSHAILAASTSHRVVREDQGVMETVEPTFDPAKVHQIAVARTQRDLGVSFPPRGSRDGATKEDTAHAAAVTMAKQMYSLLPQAREIAAVETSGQTGAQDHLTTGLEPGRQPVNLLSAAQKRVTERLAQIDDEQRSMRMYQSARTSPTPPSISSFRRRRLSTSDAETTSVARGYAPRTRLRRLTSKEDMNDVNGVSRLPNGDAVTKMAEKNAEDTMRNIDRDLYMYAGRPSPEVLREWERKANERAMAVKAPPTSTFGSRTGSQFEDNPHVRALARSRLQPTLAAMDDRVNQERARAIEKKLDEAHGQRYQKRQKEREVETMKLHTKLLGESPRAFKDLGDANDMVELTKQKTKKDVKAEKKKKEKKKEKKQKKDFKAKDHAEGEEKPPKEKTADKNEDERHAGLDGLPENKRSPPRSHVKQRGEGEPSKATEGAPASSSKKEKAEQSKPAESAAQRNEASTEAPPEAQPQQEAHHTASTGTSGGMGGPLSQWSTSNDGEAARPVEPEQPTPAESKRASKRFSLKGIFGRTGPRDTGTQGSFEVQRPTGSVARDAVEDEPSGAPVSIQPAVPSQRASQPGTVPRSSKFQEDL
ncbi:Eisosome assembly protein [Emydomyces testavorans]|uniref:Eisosome assembly protein n=1 Tax=Emydomyces testavorans TaxID=2070801 RepID=A0AAF0DP56_9EURO|nr:Eisosome assembly protein [Emydomyces testavorans]